MYSVSQNFAFYSSTPNEYNSYMGNYNTNNNSHSGMTVHDQTNMYYNSTNTNNANASHLWPNDSNYKTTYDAYNSTCQNKLPVYSTEVYAPLDELSVPQAKKSRKNNFNSSQLDDEEKNSFKCAKTSADKVNYNAQNLHNCSISSCHSPTASMTSSSNNSSSDELIFESLFKAYQSGSLSKSKYRRLMANERERKRMHGLNTAFENLRLVLPSLGSNKQFSKFET